MRRLSPPKLLRYLLFAALLFLLLHLVRLPDSASNPRNFDETIAHDEADSKWLGVPTPAKPNLDHGAVAQTQQAPLARRRRKTSFFRWSSRVHAFYYPWYASPSIEGKYLHWNHRYLAPWQKNKLKDFVPGSHQPPDDIASMYYPALGAYSSRNRTVVQTHMWQLMQAGIGVAVVSWYPAALADPNGEPSDDIVPLLLDAAARHGVQIAFHLEPYEERTPAAVKTSLEYIVDKYGDHEAFYRIKWKPDQPAKPLVYVYDSYQTDANAWTRLLSPQGDMTIRGTKYDCYMLGLLLDIKDINELQGGHFDGFYTYFASRGFTYGSEWIKWPELREVSMSRGLMFVPSVGPGYDDTSIRPWNRDNTQERRGGDYYRDALGAAITLQPPVISITSFNEWGEGTQIEPAIPFAAQGREYLNYLPLNRDGYLDITREEVQRYRPT